MRFGQYEKVSTRESSRDSEIFILLGKYRTSSLKGDQNDIFRGRKRCVNRSRHSDNKSMIKIDKTGVGRISDGPLMRYRVPQKYDVPKVGSRSWVLPRIPIWVSTGSVSFLVFNRLLSFFRQSQ